MTPEAEPKTDVAAVAPSAAPAAVPPAPAPKPPEPRYRYFTVPPAAVRLPVDDLTALLPAGAWIGTDADKRRDLALPTAEVLEKNFPRIRFSRLSDLLPGCIQPVPDAPEWIVLPTDRIALAYQPETRRELIAEPERKTNVPAVAAPVTPEKSEPVTKAIPAWKRLLKPTLAPPPAEAKAGETSKVVEGETKPAELPAPTPAPTPAPVEPASPVTGPAPVPFPLGEVRVSPEAEARLQQALMTEDVLPVTRLVELGGALPSLQGIILTRGSETVRSNEHLARLDAAELVGGADEVLRRMGSGSGLNLKPALTLYTDSGPVSFLRHGPLHLVVIHRERAFLPGVREKLEAILEAIAAAL